MSVSEEPTVETKSGNELDDDKSLKEALSVPAHMPADIRREYLKETVKVLPAKVQNRIVALKNIQLDYLRLEAEFFEEVYKLEKKYHLLYQAFFDKRKDIVNGVVDPLKEKPAWQEDPESTNELDPEATEALKKLKNIPEDAKGIPKFWLSIFRNSATLSDMVQEHDEPALRKLTDITIKYDEEHSYTIKFHFEKNDFFFNSVLTKQYFLKSRLDEEHPFAFKGPEIAQCKGCAINWKKKMNLTVKSVIKKQKHKGRGAVRIIKKEVPTDSFFNFFDPPEMQTDKQEIDEEAQEALTTDFDIGHFLRSKIIPKAVLYYTGDIVENEDDDDDYKNGEGEKDSDDSAQDFIKASAGNKKNATPNDCGTQ